MLRLITFLNYYPSDNRFIIKDCVCVHKILREYTGQKVSSPFSSWINELSRSRSFLVFLVNLRKRKKCPSLKVAARLPIITFTSRKKQTP